MIKKWDKFGLSQRSHFLLNLFNTIPTLCTISVDFLFAMSFPNAFPLTVSADTNALNMNCISNGIFNSDDIFMAINALIDPLSTPQMSPITSAHIFATFGAFFISFIESFEPWTFFVALAWNSSMFATVTATPIISNTIPIPITNTNITAPIIPTTFFHVEFFLGFICLFSYLIKSVI